MLQNTATSQTINGVTFTVNEDKSITCNGTATATALLKMRITLDSQAEYILSGCPVGGNQNTYRLDIRYVRTGTSVPDINGKIIMDTGKEDTFTIADGTECDVAIRIEKGYTCDNLIFSPMIRKADIEDDIYEPYHAPITTNLYLPEPLKMVGDKVEYVDYQEQKQHFADGTSVDVMFPALPTIVNTNILSIDTQVQPSKVMVKGKIKAHPTGGENNG